MQVTDQVMMSGFLNQIMNKTYEEVKSLWVSAPPPSTHASLLEAPFHPSAPNLAFNYASFKNIKIPWGNYQTENHIELF